MKRKLPFSEKGKGVQSITKFFKSLTPQGPKQSCAVVDDSVSMKTTKEGEFRTPIFEKLQAEKASLISKDSCPRMSPDISEIMDNKKSSNSESKSVPNEQSGLLPWHSSPMDISAMMVKQKISNSESQSLENEQSGLWAIKGELSVTDCDETFLSANENSDAWYDTCFESPNNKSCSKSRNIGTDNDGDGDLDLAGSKEDQRTDFPGHQDAEIITKDVPVEENNCVDLKGKVHDCGVQEGDLSEENKELTKLTTVSLPKDVEKTDSLNKDQNSICDDRMEGKHNYDCDIFKEEGCSKNSDLASGPNSDSIDQCDSSDELKELKFSKNVDNCKKRVVDEDSDCSDGPLSNVHIDRDSSDGHITEGSDSSDEDLLTPPVFLSKMKLKPDIRTPEKGIAPAYSTPSPVIRDVEKEDKTKFKLSINKLIKEKVKQKETDAELANMIAELKQGLEKGGIGGMQVPSTFSDIESEEELMDDGRDLKDCTLPKDIKKFLVDVHDFSEELPGEDIFPMFTPYVTSQDFPRLSMLPHPERNSFEEKLLMASGIDLQELLCGGWILQHYLNRPCPREVCDWLFQIMCRHSDQHIISSAFQVLWTMIEAATEDRADLSQMKRGSLWVPNIKEIIIELLSFGATVPRLFPGCLVDQLNIKEILTGDASCGEIHLEDVKASDSHQSECFPAINIMHLIQFLTHCLQKCHSFTVQDLRNLVVLLCRLTLDVRLQTVVFDLEMCLAAVLNSYGESQWFSEMKELCSIVATLSTNHRNLLHLVQIQPPSVRGIQLQRVLSMTLLQGLVLKFCKQEETEKVIVSKKCDASVPDSVEVSELVKLVERLQPGEASDYFLLHTIISLVNLAVGSEDLSPKERGSLEKLTSKLRTLNGDIKDPMAAFMNRTKVKDLLVRTILRLDYMTQCIKPSREQHITNYFEYSSSDYQVELLKETKNENEEELLYEEEEATIGQEMDFTASN